MIIGKLLNLDIAEGDSIVETCWEVAKDEAMSMDKHTYYTQKPEELEAYVFQEITVTRDTNWYGRAKYRTKLRGWSDWNNLDIIAVASTEDIGEVKTLPSRLAIPRVETYYYDMKVNTEVVIQKDPLPSVNHPVIGFAIKADGYSSITGAIHVATSYYLEDIDRNVIWKSENNTIDLYVKRVDTVSLEDNKAYRVRVVFHSSTNDVSDGGTKTFVTRRYGDKTLSTFLENVLGPNNFYLSEENTFTPPVGDREVGIELMIMDYGPYGSRVIFNASTDGTKPEISFKPDVLGVDRTYVVLYRVKSWKEGVKPGNGAPTEEDVIYGPWGYFVLDTRNHKERRPTIALQPYTITPTKGVTLVNGVYEMEEDICTFKVGNILSRRGVSVCTTNASSGYIKYPTDVYPLEGELSIFTTENFDETVNGGVFDVLLESAGNTPETIKVKGQTSIKYPFDDTNAYIVRGDFIFDNTVTPTVNETKVSINKDVIDVVSKIDYALIKNVDNPIKSGVITLETKEGTIFKPSSNWNDYPVDVKNENRISVIKEGKKNKFFKELKYDNQIQQAFLRPGVYEFFSPLINPNSFTDGGVIPKQVKFTLDIKHTASPLNPANYEWDLAVTNDPSVQVTKTESMLDTGDSILGIFWVSYVNDQYLDDPLENIKCTLCSKNGLVLEPNTNWNDHNIVTGTNVLPIDVSNYTEADGTVEGTKFEVDYSGDNGIISNGNHQFVSPLIYPESLGQSNGSPKKVNFMLKIDDKTPPIPNIDLNANCLDIEVENPGGNSVKTVTKSIRPEIQDDCILFKCLLEWSRGPMFDGATSYGVTAFFKTQKGSKWLPVTTWDDPDTTDPDKPELIKPYINGDGDVIFCAPGSIHPESTRVYATAPIRRKSAGVSGRGGIRVKFIINVNEYVPLTAVDIDRSVVVNDQSGEFRNITKTLESETINISCDVTVPVQTESKLEILLKDNSGNTFKIEPYGGRKQYNNSLHKFKELDNVGNFSITTSELPTITTNTVFGTYKIDTRSLRPMGGFPSDNVMVMLTVNTKQKTNIPLVNIDDTECNENFTDGNGMSRAFEIRPDIEQGMSSGRPKYKEIMYNNVIVYGVGITSARPASNFSYFKCPFAQLRINRNQSEDKIEFPHGTSNSTVYVDYHYDSATFTAEYSGSLYNGLTFTSPPIKGRIVDDKIDFNADDVFYVMLEVRFTYTGRPPGWPYS